MSDQVDSFEAFEREVLNIRVAWELWSLINGEKFDASNAEALFDTAPTFHWYTSQSFLGLVVLGLSRLADPIIDPRRRENLTLERIMDETDFSNRVKGDAPATQSSNKALKEIRSDEFRTLRNKVLAHNDLATIIGKNASLKLKVIERAVHYVASFHASIKAVREGSVIDHATGEGVIPSPIDVQKCWKEIEALINRLKDKN